MDRKEFFALVGTGAAALLVPACIGGLSSCSKSNNVTAPSNVNFSVDVSTGALAAPGGYIVSNGVIVAHALSGGYLAVSARCTHEGVQVVYEPAANDFYCSAHGSKFAANGSVTNGPATTALKQYTTTLNGNTLTVTG